MPFKKSSLTGQITCAPQLLDYNGKSFTAFNITIRSQHFNDLREHKRQFSNYCILYTGRFPDGFIKHVNIGAVVFVKGVSVDPPAGYLDLSPLNP